MLFSIWSGDGANEFGGRNKGALMEVEYELFEN
jgi:RES domain-containing protein